MGTGFDYRQVGDRLWPVLRQLMKGHTLVYRGTHGLVGHRFPGAPPTLLLDHVGAKTGKTRTTPLTYMRDGANFVLVASKGGHPRNPSWYHNLLANPETTVQVGSQRKAVRARVATHAERARLWPRVVELYGGYRDYQERTSAKSRSSSSSRRWSKASSSFAAEAERASAIRLGRDRQGAFSLRGRRSQSTALLSGTRSLS